jgi:hypothetical protein
MIAIKVTTPAKISPALALIGPSSKVSMFEGEASVLPPSLSRVAIF